MGQQLTNEILGHCENKRILVTGASGYLATNLVRALKDVNCTLVRLSRRRDLPAVSGSAQVVDICGDICVTGVLEQGLGNVDIVFHLAAQTSVHTAAQDAVRDLEINVLPMLTMLEICRESAIHPAVIFAGTATETGITKTVPVDETNVDRPVTIYDLHKLTAENYLKHYCKEGVVRGATLRLANVYGPGPESSSSDRAMVNMMIRKALAGEELTVYGKGDCLRDYIYVDDVISAFLHAASGIDELNGKHFVIGAGKGYSVAEAVNLIAERVAAKTGSAVAVKHVEPPGGASAIDSRDFVAETGRFRRACGWKAFYSLRQGIDRTVEALLEKSRY